MNNNDEAQDSRTCQRAAGYIYAHVEGLLTSLFSSFFRVVSRFFSIASILSYMWGSALHSVTI